MKYLWKVLIAMAVMLALVVVPPAISAVSPNTLTLENKVPGTWVIITDGRSGTLSYYPNGTTFDFSFSAVGLEASTSYDLIYYANPYPGNNPGKLIGTGTSDGSGSLTIIGTPDLGMSLPTPPDSNMVVDHCGSPDYYTTCFGAKIWLVPSDCYTESSITTWSPTRFLFETNLINYVDTDLLGEDVVSLTTTVTEPMATIGLDVLPTTLAFGSVDVNTCSSEHAITLTNIGNVKIKITAIASAGFYANCLRLDGDMVSVWESATIPVGGSLDVYAKVCPTPAYAGTQTGSVSFVASFTP